MRPCELRDPPSRLEVLTDGFIANELEVEAWPFEPPLEGCPCMAEERACLSDPAEIYA